MSTVFKTEETDTQMDEYLNVSGSNKSLVMSIKGFSQAGIKLTLKPGRANPNHSFMWLPPQRKDYEKHTPVSFALRHNNGEALSALVATGQIDPTTKALSQPLINLVAATGDVGMLSSVLSIKNIDLKSTCDKTKSNAVVVALTTLSSSEIINSSTWEGESTHDQLRNWLADRTGQIAAQAIKLQAKGNRVPFFRELLKQVIKAAGLKNSKTDPLPTCIDLEATASMSGPVSALDFINQPSNYARLIRNCIVDGKPVKVLPGSTDDLLKLEVVLVNASGKELVCTYDWDVKALRELFTQYQHTSEQTSVAAPQASSEIKDLTERLKQLGNDVAGVRKDVSGVKTGLRELEQSSSEMLSFTEGSVCDARHKVGQLGVAVATETKRGKDQEQFLNKKLNKALEEEIEEFTREKGIAKLFDKMQTILESMFNTWKIAGTDFFNRKQQSMSEQISGIADGLIDMIPGPFKTPLQFLKKLFVDDKINQAEVDRYRKISELVFPGDKSIQLFARELSYIYTVCVINKLSSLRPGFKPVKARKSGEPGVPIPTVIDSIPEEMMEKIAILVQSIIAYHIYNIDSLKLDPKLPAKEKTAKLIEKLAEKFSDDNGGEELLNDLLKKIVNKFAPSKTRSGSDSKANEHGKKKGLLDWCEAFITAKMIKGHAAGTAFCGKP